MNAYEIWFPVVLKSDTFAHFLILFNEPVGKLLFYSINCSQVSSLLCLEQAVSVQTFYRWMNSLIKYKFSIFVIVHMKSSCL